MNSSSNTEFKSPSTRSIALALLCFAITVYSFKQAMLSFQERTGSVLADPLQSHLGPFELHIPIFVVTYAPVLLGIFVILWQRIRREDFIYAYCILQIFRLCSIYLVPLEAPPRMITLWDPVADYLVFGTVITKDLFFSGHVSTLTLFSFFFSNPKLRVTYRVLAALDAVLLTAQHVHYTADVLFAPLFAYAAYRIQGFLKRKIARN